MSGTRRRYKREFKIDAVRLLKNSNRSVTDVARDLGISPSLLWRWKREFSSEAEAQDNDGNLNSDFKEMRQLKRELKLVKEERNVLRKALAILSKQLDVK